MKTRTTLSLDSATADVLKTASKKARQTVTAWMTDAIMEKDDRDNGGNEKINPLLKSISLDIAEIARWRDDVNRRLDAVHVGVPVDAVPPHIELHRRAGNDPCDEG